MVYKEDGKRHFIRPLLVCEIIELDEGTDIVLANNKVIHFEEDYITVCKTVIDNEDRTLNVRKVKGFVK